jgi:hypothetical protein
MPNKPLPQFVVPMAAAQLNLGGSVSYEIKPFFDGVLKVTYGTFRPLSLQGGRLINISPESSDCLPAYSCAGHEPGRRYVSMPKPLLNLCDIGIVGESVRGRCGPQRMHTEAVDLGADARFQAVFPNDIAVNRCRIQVPVKAACPVVLHRPEQSTLHISPMSRERQIILNQPLCWPR